MGKKDLSQVVAENGHPKVKEVFDKKFGSAGLTNNHGTPKVDLAGSGDHDGSDPINKEDVPLDFSRYNELEGGFPLPMTQAAFYGIAGHVVDAITEESEACREAVLMQFLCSLGNEIGRSTYWENFSRRLQSPLRPRFQKAEGFQVVPPVVPKPQLLQWATGDGPSRD